MMSRRALVGGMSAASAAMLLAACGSSSKSTTTASISSTATSGSAGASTSTSSTGTSATAATGSASPVASAAAAGGSPKKGGSIIIGTLGEAATINPFVANESESNWRVKMLFDQFVRLDPQSFAPKPGLAKSWEINTLTFTFKLQDTVKFSDGSDLTADDVAFTMKGILAKDTASPRATRLLSIKGAKEFNGGTAQDVPGITVTDPKTLKVELADPDASFLINMEYVSPAPKAMLDGKNLSQASKEGFFQKPVGAGPFVFVSWNVGGDFVAQRNTNYYQTGKPYLDKFTHRVIADSQSLVNSLLSGDIDGSIYPSPAGYQQLKDNKDLNVLVPPFTAPDGWQFNMKKNPYLAKKEVRQAVAYALDMTQFAKDSLYGLGKPGTGPIAPGNFAYDKTLKPYPYDLDKAKSLIQQAGTPPDGIKFTVNKGNVLREDFLTYTQAQLEKIGWKIVPEAIEYATLVDEIIHMNYDVGESQEVGSGATVNPGDLYEIYVTGGSENFMGYSNPQLDTLLAQAKKELDPNKQVPIYAQIQQILVEDLPATYSWYRPFLHVAKKKFTGYVDSDLEEGMFTELENWYLSE
jgi:peptide/nickel transport system substrate-binding protein